MKIKHLALCSLFAALMAICAWIAIPVLDMAVTLQTFAIFLALFTLGGKRGCVSIFVYLLLGAVGLPVFSGIRGGLSALLGVTGGYIWGFLVGGLIYWGITRFFTEKFKILSAILTLLACYTCGTLWYYFAYSEGGLLLIAVKCVAPYILPDAVKIWMAFYVSKRLKQALHQ